MKILFGGDFFVRGKIHLSADLLSHLKSFDKIFVNFEAAVNIKKLPRHEKVGAYLEHDENVINTLNRLKITDLCLANNHYFDFGKLGAKVSSKYLANNNFRIHGIDENNKFMINSIDRTHVVINVAESEFGVKSFLRYRENDEGFLSVTSPRLFVKINEQIKKGKKIILIVHAGLENTCRPLKQWIDYYEAFIDIGVYAVICHHPHVPQFNKLLADKNIYPSLGNFFFENNRKKGIQKLGMLVEFDTTNSLWNHRYIIEVNGVYEILNNVDKIDYFLSRESCKDPVINLDAYLKFDLKRIILSKFPSSFISLNPNWSNKLNRSSDFFIHNARFESHRYAQEQYYTKMRGN
ncbi:CapA family protein [Vibrio diabolicus]|uniref:CapA family protein n=1 Tax=Vibrio diabolicus TaxID=50719 RepID=UPI00249437EE|nr:CapA family protein [Vibrio diabolicus]